MRSHSPIGTRSLDYSNLGIHTHYRIALLLADAEARQRIAGLRRAGYHTSLRVRVGNMLIMLGAAIAGTTHDLQERQATLSSLARKPGFSPTR